MVFVQPSFFGWHFSSLVKKSQVLGEGESSTSVSLEAELLCFSFYLTIVVFSQKGVCDLPKSVDFENIYILL